MAGDIEIKGKIRKITNNHRLKRRFEIVDLREEKKRGKATKR